MISTERFLALLEERELLSPRAVANLRAQITQSAKPISADSIARRLVKHGHLTPAQAKRLLESGEERPVAPKPESKPESKPAPAKPQPRTEDSELGFAPLEEDQGRTPGKKALKPQVEKPAAKPVEKPVAKQPEKPVAKPVEKPAVKQPEKPVAKPVEKPAAKQQVEKTSPKQPSAPPVVSPPPAPPVSKHSKAGALFDDELPTRGETLGSPSGPLDGIMSDAAMAAAESGSPLSSTSSQGKGFMKLFARKPKDHKETEAEKWGSPLMLIGGGGLLVIVILIAALVWGMMRGNSAKMFQLADDSYKATNYPQAIKQYQEFLEKFSGDSSASLARVRIGLAQMRQANSSGNWPDAARTADEVVHTISQETDFKEAYGELASMLSDIVSGLAADARKKSDQKMVDQAYGILKIIDNPMYVPKENRPESKLKEVHDTLGLTVREIARGVELDKAVSAMKTGVKQSNTEDAYSAYRALLRQYPDLVGDAKLKKAILEVSVAQQAMVKMVAAQKPAEGAEVETAVMKSVTLTRRDLKSAIPDVDGQIALAAVDGAVYGLDCASGKVLWRRFIGFDANPQAPSFPPTFLSSEPNSDALVVDTVRNEILRLESATGRSRWRHAVGEPFDAQPIIAGETILIAARDGKLLLIDAAKGTSSGFVKFPQHLGVAPVFDSRRSLIFQVASHSNIFVYSLDENACKHVYSMGHEPGTVTTAPLVIDDYLLAAVNDGANDSFLQLFAIQPKKSEKEDSWLKPIQKIPLKGHIQTQPLADGRRVLVTTNRGDVRVFELNASEAKNPLRDVAGTSIESNDNLVRFPLIQGGQFWIADNQLTKYDIQAASGKLMPKWIANADRVFLQPPVAVGQAIISVLRKPGMPGAVVSAVAMKDPPSIFWETQLASPLAGEPLTLAGDGKILAVTANGGVFRMDSAKAEAATFEEPVAAADILRFRNPFTGVVRLADDWVAMCTGKAGDPVGVFDPKAPSPMIYMPELPDALPCFPGALGRGLLIPGKAGQVFLLNPQSGERLAEPFQPRLEPGSQFDWISPTTVKGEEVLLTDGKLRIYRLGIQDQPKPHLKVLAEVAVTKLIAVPLAVLGETVFAVDEAGGLTAYELPKLAKIKETPLGGNCTWGPARAGDCLLVSTDNDQLFCFDAKGTQLWQKKLEYGPLAGNPLQRDKDIVLASRNGIVWRIDAATGKELGKVDTGCPLGTGPVLFTRRGGSSTAAPTVLFVGGHDGTLYEVRQP